VITYMARCPDTGEHVLSIDDTKSEL
jgi:hypothetical protein